jgi:hypothetical protein
MNPTTIQAIGGTCSIIRQALITIEAIIAAETAPALAQNATMRENQASSGEEFKYLLENEEDAVQAAYGLSKC